MLIAVVSDSHNNDRAIKEVKNYIKNADVLLFLGDGENDIDMLQFAGLGVAMGNASNYVQSKADYVTLSNEENGIADVIYKKILNI